MTIFPSHEQVNQAWQAALEALNLSQDASLQPCEMSVFFKYLLVEGLTDRTMKFGRQESLNQVREHLESRLGAVQLALRLDGDFGGRLRFDRLAARRSLHSSPRHLQRLVDLALAAMVSENLAPEICLHCQALSAADLATALPGTCNHAVIFQDAVLFHQEFYPLAVDSYVRDSQRHGCTRTNVIGARADWLSADGMLHRILFMDLEADRLREAELSAPLRADSAQFLCLGRDERRLHAQLSAQLSCPQVNPYGISSLADDKAATLAGWAARGLEVPAFMKLTAGDHTSASRFLACFDEVVVKPNRSTEGHGVGYFKKGRNHAQSDLVESLEHCWIQDEAVIQERRDGLLFRDTRSGTLRTLALRLNLALHGEGYQVTSGYVQLGRDAEHPAARGQGGLIVPLTEILQGLVSRNDPAGPELSFGAEDWARIRDQAKRAASLFPGLCLCGLDVLLDLDTDGSILPVFLEANPRPAGLCHSRLLDGFPDSCLALNGVSLELWDELERWRKQPLLHHAIADHEGNPP